MSGPTPADLTCTRRRLLGLFAAGCGIGLAVARPLAAAGPATRQLRFHHLHTGESLTEIYWENGRYVPDGLAAIDNHLRDFRDGSVKAIDPGLLDLLHDLLVRLDYDRAIQVISGYRSAATNAMLARRSNGVAKNSYHVRGMAIDLRLPGRRLREVQGAALDLARGGVGFYPKSDFVHVDTGPARAW